ncbi:hypothetical protein [Janthinobacterium lividum]|uniref:hypothetical protein n=1 Tax=Janthinobacterium lividum TaxID=29581 RepID=UPI001B8398F6|nr:hypothetical protein [Janthinobacterium lividum]MBR7631804.1 hypothetical protein [Janthinobacterium lividum]
MLSTLTDSPRQIALGDRVTFDTDEGYQAGTVNDLRRDVGNGELHAWVELDHQWAGVFRAVPLCALVSVEQAKVLLRHKGSALGKTTMSSQAHKATEFRR